MVEFNILKKLSMKFNDSFFFYNLDDLQVHIRQLQKLPIKLWYAVKANPLSDIIEIMKLNNINFDVASIGELNQIIFNGVSKNKILSTGPSKPTKYLSYYLDIDIRIYVVESIEQFLILNVLSKKKKKKIHILLRIQLSWEFMGKNVLGGDQVTPFGLYLGEWKSLFCSNSYKKNHYFKIVGFHCFQWGNILDPKKLLIIWLTIVQTILNFSILYSKFKIIDLGGGLGVNYNSKNKNNFQLIDVINILIILKHKFPQFSYWLELGRYFIAEYGYYLTTITDIKQVQNKKIIILSGGSHHLLRPAITKESFYADVFTNQINDGGYESYEIHGPLCTNLDIMGTLEFPKNITIGTKIIFFKIGAYGFTESMPFFLCHSLPAEIVLHKQKLKISRQPKNSKIWLV